jgi:hypothetical protein
MRKFNLALVAVALPLAACSSVGGTPDLGIYQLVRAKPTKVGNGGLEVTPPRPWNRQRRVLFL